MDFDDFPCQKFIRDPDLVHYACIAKGTTILAEFNSKDAALAAIAVKCLDKTPPFHSMFTHTVRSETYAFLIDKPIVCFAIFDQSMDKSEGLTFLKRVRAALAGVIKSKSLESLGSHCFQGEFNPVFRHLLGLGIEKLDSPNGQRFDQSEDLKCGSSPIVVSSDLDGEKGSRKMKNRLLGEFSVGRKNSGKERESDEDEGKGVLLNREFSVNSHRKGGFYPEEMLVHNQKAKKIWKKQVWIILSLDLFICLILFAIWLWVCSGFKCMDS